jgi:aspartate-semialdehyde dehydrogenase
VLWNEGGGSAPGTLEAVGSDGIHVAALRTAGNDPRWLHFWAAADSVRQGAALAAVAIAESILRHRSA